MSPWGDACTGHVPSRRPSPSASTTGSNPPWRTWQIALATPALLQPGPAPHTRIPFNPNELPQGPGARREVGHWRWSRVSESVTSFLQLYKLLSLNPLSPSFYYLLFSCVDFSCNSSSSFAFYTVTSDDLYFPCKGKGHWVERRLQWRIWMESLGIASTS